MLALPGAAAPGQELVDDLPAELAAVRLSQVHITAPDGARLLADLYQPAATGRYPALFLPTPYDSRQSPSKLRFGRTLAAAGYAVVILNVRGKFGSEGEFLPFIDEIPDLVAAADWIARQPWYAGGIGLMGSSSQSYSNQLLASTGHPEVKALANWSGLTDTRELFFPGGAFRLNTLYPWLQFFYLEQPIRSLDEWNARFRKRPMRENFAWGSELIFEMADGMVDVDAIDVPTLQITGWNDVVYRQTLYFYRRLRERGAAAPAQHLIVGPWMHNQIGTDRTRVGDKDFGPRAAFDQDRLLAELVRWFDRHVKGIDNRASGEPTGELYVMGRDEWIERDQWPPRDSIERRWFLAPAPEATGPVSGALAATPPREGRAQSRFTFDPDDPFPIFGGVNSHIFDALAGLRDQARFDDRTDVVRFQTEPFDAPLVLAGPMRVELWAETDAEDADFTAKLVVVQPDGYQRIVEDGIVRGRYRDGIDAARPLGAGRVHRLEIDLGSTLLEIAPGSRLRLDVSSSNFPKYDLNPGTEVHPFEATEFRRATQTVHHSTERPSALVVRVLTSQLE